MKFDTGFFAGLIIIWIGIIASPGTIGLAIFDMGGVFIKKNSTRTVHDQPLRSLPRSNRFHGKAVIHSRACAWATFQSRSSKRMVLIKPRLGEHLVAVFQKAAHFDRLFALHREVELRAPMALHIIRHRFRHDVGEFAARGP